MQGTIAFKYQRDEDFEQEGPKQINNMDNRRFTFLALSQFVHHHLLWFLISAYAIATVFPRAGLWIRTVTFGDASWFQTPMHVSLLLLLLATLKIGRASCRERV